MKIQNEKHAFLIQTTENYNNTRTQQCFLCIPPFPGYNNDEHYYIIASAVKNHYIHETYIFPAHKIASTWEIKDYLELPGSQKHTTDIEAVLTEAGYTIMEI